MKTNFSNKEGCGCVHLAKREFSFNKIQIRGRDENEF